MSSEEIKRHRTKVTCNVFSWIFAAVAALCLIGALVVLVMLGVGERNSDKDFLLSVLCGAFAGGLVVFALAGLGFFRLTANAEKAERDAAERADSEDSFFVGDGTLATFCDGYLLLHARGNDEKHRDKIKIPYADIRCFSVCTRRTPSEKGEWSVVFEIPVRYLAKSGKTKKDEPPALVQTDAKQRLYDCLKKYSLPLLGELPDGRKENKKFTCLKKIALPDEQKRKRAVVFAGVGFILAVVGIVLAFTLSSPYIGTIVAVFGAFVGGRAVASFAKAKSVLAFYEEGVYWREPNRYECVFLKWEEIKRISRDEKDGYPLLRFECEYGAYHFPDAKGAYAYLKERCAEKCGDDK